MLKTLGFRCAKLVCTRCEPCTVIHSKKMEYNLLLRLYDYHCSLFIDGKICLEMFQGITKEYEKRKLLFTINLN